MRLLEEGIANGLLRVASDGFKEERDILRVGKEFRIAAKGIVHAPELFDAFCRASNRANPVSALKELGFDVRRQQMMLRATQKLYHSFLPENDRR